VNHGDKNCSSKSAFRRIKLIKVSWSWILPFFSPFFGIPLFRRELIAWGFVFLTLSVLGGIGNLVGNDSGGPNYPALGQRRGLRADDLHGRQRERDDGQELSSAGLADSDTTRFAKMNWQLFDLKWTPEIGPNVKV
jgi:hypothetical protein